MTQVKLLEMKVVMYEMKDLHGTDDRFNNAEEKNSELEVIAIKNMWN